MLLELLSLSSRHGPSLSHRCDYGSICQPAPLEYPWELHNQHAQSSEFSDELGLWKSKVPIIKGLIRKSLFNPEVVTENRNIGGFESQNRACPIPPLTWDL